MSQQINLFNPVFLKQKKYFSAVTMAQGLGLIALGTAGVLIYAQLQVANLTKSADASKQQLQATQAQVAKISVTYAPRKPSKALEEDIQRIEAELKAQKQALDTVKDGGFGDTRGYSEYLRAFARQAVPGLWLTGFRIVGSGDVELSGRTLQPDLVPAYINRLKQEPVMRGKSFSALEMGASKVQPDKPSAGAQASPESALHFAPFVEFTLRSAGSASKTAAGTGGAK